ncbi:predicted protein [Uncinocarpus reesii 1704]|uniref:Uncharacterized protein n=1 Tax=Uncinocarpus reesii (strain UAMH 1704) TaxID=336963 RepID=C4JTB2_UNCRE|nr:uncharacterized protein UREG_05701 [Uncinocarpus reesii 1704]EEP80859.1 predicted protein [Uncinocarpus reesii 1704]
MCWPASCSVLLGTHLSKQRQEWAGEGSGGPDWAQGVSVGQGTAGVIRGLRASITAKPVSRASPPSSGRVGAPRLGPAGNGARWEEVFGVAWPVPKGHSATVGDLRPYGQAYILDSSPPVRSVRPAAVDDSHISHTSSCIILA